MSSYEHPSALRGNGPERWNRLLEVLDERLQFGLLDRLKKVQAYHFEAELLFIEACSAEEERYLMRESVQQQLSLFAEEVGAKQGARVRQIHLK